MPPRPALTPPRPLPQQSQNRLTARLAPATLQNPRRQCAPKARNHSLRRFLTAKASVVQPRTTYGRPHRRPGSCVSIVKALRSPPASLQGSGAAGDLAGRPRICTFKQADPCFRPPRRCTLPRERYDFDCSAAARQKWKAGLRRARLTPDQTRAGRVRPPLRHFCLSQTFAGPAFLHCGFRLSSGLGDTGSAPGTARPPPAPLHPGFLRQIAL